ncbi:DUF5928 domain-containing protein [Pukyongiella litopenaei]|uniref:Peptide O-xylosyltransferase n=1 Tax=Pukyongiella litopenaei TaxID=2605946 RepID=A0A2S0MPL1_9RHOB|nr:DUF5928 domain-containing protein [Pukyongiella litopenaei]AVO37815.1 beta-1,6-N-acetylglucosaminyltransferase [Pukyongiella litopenaei]
MAKIAYLLLCHKDPDAVIEQARSLTAAGDCMVIHFDANSDAGDFRHICDALADEPGVMMARRRVRCGWGEWSLVQATLTALETALDAFPDATHFYMVSGDCMAIKTAEYARGLLDREDADYIECFDFFESDWIKTGMKEERLIYRHYLNERKHKRLFYAMQDVQRRLGLQRAIPADLRIMIGSQWWCLRRTTVEAIFEFLGKRRDVLRFFRTTWIPDETFFQTLVRHLVPAPEIRARTLTFLMFTDYGMPVTFHNDHYDLLLAQDYLFARKISPAALELKNRLGDLYARTGVTFHISNEGRELHRFLTSRGRIGNAYAQRFWETEASLGRDRDLMIIVCKKWHVARRLLDRIRRETGIPAAEYLFDEEQADLPDLGGLETSLKKRTRHRRSLMRILFDAWQTDRMVICLDPGHMDLLRDFDADTCTTRILELDCDFSDDDLAGHANRIGLAADDTPASALDRLLPALRREIRQQSDTIRDGGFAHFTRVREGADRAELAAAVGRFLSVPADTAARIADIDDLFGG